MQKQTILIVDDTPGNIDVLCAALGDAYDIKVATNGEKALRIAAATLPGLILLDIMMPDMDGYEVCRKLKQQPETQGIPVIFVTALGEVADEERGLDVGAVDYIVKPISPAIVRARVRTHLMLKLRADMLETLACVDCVTSIANRRRYNEALDSEWRRAARAGLPLALIMIDIDHFKAYNDNYGHGAGDACLRQVAAALAGVATCRPADLVARYGGEEFVALLPETDTAGAALLAERFRASIEALRIEHSGAGASPWLTVSVGFASAVPQGDRPATELQDAADRMLYLAKAGGRNRVCGAAP